MDIQISPCKLNGRIRAIPSKSHAHRLLIASAFADLETSVVCPETNADITATVRCLNALGANITRTSDGYTIQPVQTISKCAILDCGESGATLRFLLPVAGALGVDATFQMNGRLSARPLSPLWEEMERMGCSLTRPSAQAIRCTGNLIPGEYRIAGNISSQFITGLLLAMALIKGQSHLTVIGQLESMPYVAMTQRVLQQFGIQSSNYRIAGGRPLRSPGHIRAEGDWSNAAFFLAAQALGSPLCITGLDHDSPQGDRAVNNLLDVLKAPSTIDLRNTPDLAPVLAVVAGARHGAVFTGIQRLRFKESDRIESISAMLHALDGKVTIKDDTLTVHPSPYHTGIVDSFGDHRIAMAAAIAATVCDGPVTILNAHCVNKSYPSFWEDYRRLGGTYEQFIR